jgi:drug/metabolite transporter (DMT)-like permease
MSETPVLSTARPLPLTPSLLRGSLLMVGSAAAWGMGTVMSKHSLDLLPPLPLLALQLAASIAVLWLLTLLRYPRAIRSWRDLRAGWTGILEPGLAYALGISGLALTSASSASLIFVTEPIFIIVISVLFLREKVRPVVWGTVALVIMGTLLVSGEDAGGGAQSIGGDMLLLLSTASAALYVIFSRRSVETMPPLPLAALQQSAGLGVALALLVVGFGGTGGFSPVNVSAETWGWAMLTGVVQYALAFFLYLSALRDIPASQAALFLTLIPVFGIGGAAVFLGETMSAMQFGGAGLIIGALLLLNIVQARPRN